LVPEALEAAIAEEACSQDVKAATLSRAFVEGAVEGAVRIHWKTVGAVAAARCSSWWIAHAVEAVKQACSAEGPVRGLPQAVVAGWKTSCRRWC
jgi:hypothetical protein